MILKFLANIIGFIDDNCEWIGKAIATSSILFGLFIISLALFQPRNSSPNDPITTLKLNGFVNQVLQGGEGKGCNEHELIAQRFTATRNNVRYSGVVCCYESTGPCRVVSLGEILKCQ